MWKIYINLNLYSLKKDNTLYFFISRFFTVYLFFTFFFEERKVHIDKKAKLWQQKHKEKERRKKSWKNRKTVYVKWKGKKGLIFLIYFSYNTVTAHKFSSFILLSINSISYKKCSFFVVVASRIICYFLLSRYKFSFYR